MFSVHGIWYIMIMIMMHDAEYGIRVMVMDDDDFYAMQFKCTKY